MKFLIFFPLFLFASINQKIINFYKTYYPNIKIIKITIHPAPPKKYQNIKILFSPKSTSGNIKIDNRYYFIKIEAKLPVFKSKEIIKQNEFIYNKVYKTLIPFRYFSSKPLNKIDKNLIAKNIISKNAIITDSNTAKAPAVFRNSYINAVAKSKSITVTTQVKALKNGNIGDIIPVKLKNKILKAKVIGKNLVEIK